MTIRSLVGRVLVFPLSVLFVAGALVLGIGMVAYSLASRGPARPGGCLLCRPRCKEGEECH